MADPTPSDYHLTYLRERWERDRSSRVFLQLAEEYRRRGLLAEALEVLQVGLSHHPGYLAAQVSLGRCWIEAGKPEAAAEVLTGVLAQDPTQAVASRLLIDVWLRLGDAARAAEAIDRCELLGVAPQELQGYRERLAELPPAERPGASPPAVPEEAPSPVPPNQTAGRPAGATASPVEARGPERVPAAAAAAAAMPAPPPLRPAAARTPQPAAQVFSLPPLAAPPLVLPKRPAMRRLLRVVGAGADPFQLPVPVPVAPAAGAVFALGLAAAAAPAAPAAFPPPADAAPAAVEAPAYGRLAAPLETAAAPMAFEPAGGSISPPFAPVEEEPPAEASMAAEPQASPPSPFPPEPAPPVEPAPALEEPIAPALEEAAWWRGGAAAAPPEPGAAPEGVEMQPSGALPAPELRPSDPGTATLGELYLRQGHLGEAGSIFHQVLERDPDNAVARRGLETIAQRRDAALTAAELMRGAGPEVKGLTSRKIVLLQRYVEQIRAAAARQPEPESHVPRAAE